MARGIHAQAHPAGIWTDLSSEGPVIGELIVIVDRGKNLPNRKTIGKQDPYCVIRLGKEACRTEADKRGGQTPKWDKELRFKVRDSPDYKQLKLTCFNEDKKTELIGECMIKLENILKEGGGRDDGWRQLNCKGKYAGEIMLELTFWDIREKKKEQKAEGRQRNSGEDFYDEPEYVSGPRVLAGVGEVAAAKREKERERRKQREAERLKQRQREKLGLGRDLPSEPNLLDPDGEKAREKEREKEKLRANREKSKEISKKSNRSKHQTSYEDDYSREERKERERYRRRRETVAGDKDEYSSRGHRKSRKSLPAQYHYGSNLDLTNMQQHGSRVDLTTMQQHGSRVDLTTMQQHGSRVDLTMQQHGSMVDLSMRDPSPEPGRVAVSPLPIQNRGGGYIDYDDPSAYISGDEMIRHDNRYIEDGYTSQNDIYMHKNPSQTFPPHQQMYAASPDVYEIDGPPPPPPHRSMQNTSTQQQMSLRHQPSHSGLKYQPSQTMKHQSSLQLGHHPTGQLMHQPSAQSLRHRPSQQQLQHQHSQQLRHKPSMSADWPVQAADRSAGYNPRHSASFDSRDLVPPLQTHFKNFSSPDLAQEPDFEKLDAPHAPYLDEFDDSGRFSQPGSPRVQATGNSDLPNVGENGRPLSGYGTSPNAGAIVPAGYNYNDGSAYGRRGSGFGVSDTGNYSQALVTTSGTHQRPPPIHVPTSRRNSYLGDPPTIKDGIIIPPSLVPGIEPAAAEELRQLLEEERRKGKYAVPPVDSIQQQNSASAQPPPAPYVEDVNDREDGGRRRSTVPNAASVPMMPQGAPPPLLKHRPSSPSSGELNSEPRTGHSQQHKGNPANSSMGRTDSKVSQSISDPSTYTSTSGSGFTPGPGFTQENSLVAPGPPKRLAGTPFSPEAYNTLNPKAQNANFLGKGKGTIKAPPVPTRQPTRATQTSTVKQGSNNKTLKMDEILPPETFAPEPERRGVPPTSVSKSVGTVRGNNSARPPGYSATVSRPSIPTRASSKMLALTSSRRDDIPPPPPAHQALTIVNNNSSGANRSGTTRIKPQNLQPMKSISRFATRSQQNLAAQIAAYETRQQREREQAEREQQMQLAMQRQQQEQQQQQQQQQHQRQVYASHSGPVRSRYLENRKTIAAPPSSQPPPPSYGNSWAPTDEQAGAAGTLVLHRHRSAEDAWNINHSRPISYHGGSRPGSSYGNYGNSPDGYDTGMVLYRGPTGAAAPQERDSYYGNRNGASMRGRERGMSAPAPPPLGMSMANHSQNALSPGGGNYTYEQPGNGYGDHGQGGGGYAGYEGDVGGKALMSREDWLLQEEMKGIRIGVGSNTKVMSSGGTLARRGGRY